MMTHMSRFTGLSARTVAALSLLAALAACGPLGLLQPDGNTLALTTRPKGRFLLLRSGSRRQDDKEGRRAAGQNHRGCHPDEQSTPADRSNPNGSGAARRAHTT
jgi:hypothetical protein